MGFHKLIHVFQYPFYPTSNRRKIILNEYHPAHDKKPQKKFILFSYFHLIFSISDQI